MELCSRSYELLNTIWGWEWSHHSEGLNHRDYWHDCLFFLKWEIDDCFAAMVWRYRKLRLVSSSFIHVCVWAFCASCPYPDSHFAQQNCHWMGSANLRWGNFDTWLLSLHERGELSNIHFDLWRNRKCCYLSFRNYWIPINPLTGQYLSNLHSCL